MRISVAHDLLQPVGAGVVRLQLAMEGGFHTKTVRGPLSVVRCI